MRKTDTFIKICGLTDPSAARECVALGADAIGLVFYKKSPRCVTAEKAAAISRALPSDTLITGVFVNETYRFIMEKVKQLHLKAVQLHGRESPALISQLRSRGLIVIKGVFAARPPCFEEAGRYREAACLLAECGKGPLPGGNAETWNFSTVSRIAAELPVIIAGGLNTANIKQALRDADPFGVDVSSGVESSPGIKDMAKVETFITQVRS